MKLVRLSEKTVVDVDDISHTHVVDDQVHCFMKGSYPQSRLILTKEEGSKLDLFTQIV